jgi:hypothetical protein
VSVGLVGRGARVLCIPIIRCVVCVCPPAESIDAMIAPEKESHGRRANGATTLAVEARRFFLRCDQMTAPWKGGVDSLISLSRLAPRECDASTTLAKQIQRRTAGTRFRVSFPPHDTYLSVEFHWRSGDGNHLWEGRQRTKLLLCHAREAGEWICYQRRYTQRVAIYSRS